MLESPTASLGRKREGHHLFLLSPTFLSRRAFRQLRVTSPLTYLYPGFSSSSYYSSQEVEGVRFGLTRSLAAPDPGRWVSAATLGGSRRLRYQKPPAPHSGAASKPQPRTRGPSLHSWRQARCCSGRRGTAPTSTPVARPAAGPAGRGERGAHTRHPHATVLGAADFSRSR